MRGYTCNVEYCICHTAIPWGDTHPSYPNDLDGRIHGSVGAAVAFASPGPDVLVPPVDAQPLCRLLVRLDLTNFSLPRHRMRNASI